ncbi:MAG: reverse transcriptase N-terminal domain-containing protein, partial [Ardenticatenales bacterium]|nr:reverse transcriptase N-terminal domain-containing protein [Ardenticatenales bacterium]
AKEPTEWNAIDWQRAHRVVRNLRQRIFRASGEGNMKRTQRSLLEPCAGKLARTVLRGEEHGNVLLLPDVPAPSSIA